MAVVETLENETLEILQTHYYKASYEQIKKVYIEFLESINHKIVSVNDDYNEIYSEVPYMNVVAKIIMQDPLETSIDFYINSEYLMFARKKAVQFIIDALKKIEAKYELKGLSLHK